MTKFSCLSEKAPVGDELAAAGEELEVEADGDLLRFALRADVVPDAAEIANAAADLVQQFIDAGFVKQGSDGNFTIPGASVTKKFKPFGGK